MQLPIYMDNQAATRVDPRVVEAMLPYFTEKFGNAGSTTHSFGLEARAAVEESRAKIASAVGAKAGDIVFTSGATESNNLAICGAAEKLRSKGKHIVSVATEHPSVLEPLEKLARRGFEITLLPVIPAQSNGDSVNLSKSEKAAKAGLIEAAELAKTLRKDTILVSVMLANSEIGVIQPLSEIATLCKQAWRITAYRCHTGRGQNSPERRTTSSRSDELYRAQDLWAQRHRRPLPAAWSRSGAAGTFDRGRRARIGFSQRHPKRAGHCGIRSGA